MAKTILTIGEILVEIMAETVGFGFREPQSLVGPFPSGAPAIFVDQVARLGHPAAMIGRVGDDDFGRLNLDRLESDGVDVSGITIDFGAVTGSAFVRYRPDGGRDFAFNIRGSANGRLALDAAALAIIDRADHLHVVGSSFGTPAIAEAAVVAAERMKAKGGTVSFDPNVRNEMLEAPGFGAGLTRLIGLADLFLPSGGELMLFSDARGEEEALRSILARGVAVVVHKQGARGARYVDRATDVFVPAFPVDEIDPTGAGDIFGATFVVGWLNGLSPAENLRRAAAAGALAVTRKGPMEGVSMAAELDRFLAGVP